MKKLLIAILGPFLLVVTVSIGIFWWANGAPPGFRPKIHDVAFEELNYDHRGVRVKGTAHYELRIQQGEEEGDTWYIFPLFPTGDTLGKHIRVMVRTPIAPDRLLGFEDLTVEGLARPPGQLVPRSVIGALLAKGYDVDERFVLIEQFVD